MPVATKSPPPAARPYIPNRLLKIEDIADLADVSVGTIRSWIAAGKFPRPLRLGRLFRWEPEAISAWLGGR